MPRQYYRKAKKVVRYAGSAINVATKALAVAEYAASQLNAESKFENSDSTVSGQTFSWSGELTTLNAPAQGSNVNQRTGDHIKMDGGEIRGYVQQHPSAIATIVRLIVFIDKQSDNTVDGFLTNGYLSTVLAPISTRNGERLGKSFYRVLHDRVYNLEDQTELIHFKFSLKGAKGVKTQFDRSTNVAENNRLQFLMISNEQTNVPTCYYTSRVYFKDN